MTYEIGRKIRCIHIRSFYNSERSAHNSFPMRVDYLTIRREVKNDNRTKTKTSLINYCDDRVDDYGNCYRMANRNSQTFIYENISRSIYSKDRSRLYILWWTHQWRMKLHVNKFRVCLQNKQSFSLCHKVVTYGTFFYSTFEIIISCNYTATLTK